MSGWLFEVTYYDNIPSKREKVSNSFFIYYCDLCFYIGAISGKVVMENCGFLHTTICSLHSTRDSHRENILVYTRRYYYQIYVVYSLY